MRNERDDQARNDEDMQGKEAGECFTSDDRPRQQKVNQLVADQRYAAGDRCADAKAPIRILIEPEDLAGERHT